MRRRKIVARGDALRRVRAPRLLTVFAYLASALAEIVYVHAVSGQPLRWMGALAVGAAGPIAAAWLLRRPPDVSLVVLVPTYYALVAFTVSSTYDEGRWSYSRIEDGVFVLVVQVVFGFAAYALLAQVSCWQEARA